MHENTQSNNTNFVFQLNCLASAQPLAYNKNADININNKQNRHLCLMASFPEQSG